MTNEQSGPEVAEATKASCFKENQDAFDDVDKDFFDPDMDSSPRDTEIIPDAKAILESGGQMSAVFAALEEADNKIIHAYREGFAAYTHKETKAVGANGIIAEVLSIGDMFKSKNIASPGNFITRVIARAPSVPAYIRKRSKVISDQIDGVMGRIDSTIQDAVSDAKEAADTWAMYQNTVSALSELINVIRDCGANIDDRIKSEGESLDLLDDRREIDRILDRVETRVFKLNDEADALEVNVSRCRDQVFKLKDCRDFLLGMRHSIEVICLTAKSNSRSNLIDMVYKSQEELAIMGSRIAKDAAVSAAMDRERPVISAQGIKKIVSTRKGQGEAVSKVISNAEKERDARRRIRLEGYGVGIGSSRTRAIDRMIRER